MLKPGIVAVLREELISELREFRESADQREPQLPLGNTRFISPGGNVDQRATFSFSRQLACLIRQALTLVRVGTIFTRAC